MNTKTSRKIRAELLEVHASSVELATWLDLPNHKVFNGILYLKKTGQVANAGRYRNGRRSHVYKLTRRGVVVARMEQKAI